MRARNPDGDQEIAVREQAKGWPFITLEIDEPILCFIFKTLPEALVFKGAAVAMAVIFGAGAQRTE